MLPVSKLKSYTLCVYFLGLCWPKLKKLQNRLVAMATEPALILVWLLAHIIDDLQRNQGHINLKPYKLGAYKWAYKKNNVLYFVFPDNLSWVRILVYLDSIG